MKKQQIKAFTLIELIIVITILAILATIGFISFQGYTLDARDGKRISDVQEIRKTIEIYKTRKGELPTPDIKYVTIPGLSLQGYVGTGVLASLRGNDDFKDPLDSKNYTYILSEDKTKYQLMTSLEKDPNTIALLDVFNKTYSNGNDYLNRFPYVIGNYIGAITDNQKNPIQEVYTGTLNLSTYTGSLIIYETNTDNTSGTGGTIINAIGNPTIPAGAGNCVFGSSKIGECNL